MSPKQDIGSLLGARGRLTVSDPWDFVSICGTGPFDFEIIRLGVGETEGVALLRVLRPKVYQGEVREHYVASPRYRGDHLTDLLRGRTVVAGLTWIPPDRVGSEDPCDLSWWRGGLALIGQLMVR